jgi:hypothetical protein
MGQEVGTYWKVGRVSGIIAYCFTYTCSFINDEAMHISNHNQYSSDSSSGLTSNLQVVFLTVNEAKNLPRLWQFLVSARLRDQSKHKKLSVRLRLGGLSVFGDCCTSLDPVQGWYDELKDRLLRLIIFLNLIYARWSYLRPELKDSEQYYNPVHQNQKNLTPRESSCPNI